jgi:hypothetical protein
MVTFDWQFRPGGQNNIWFRLLRFNRLVFFSHSRGIDFCRCRYDDRYDVITDYTPHLHNILSLTRWMIQNFKKVGIESIDRKRQKKF